MWNRTLVAALVLPWLLPGCGGSEDIIGTWVADADATVEGMIEDQLRSMSLEDRAAVEHEVQWIRDNVPDDIRAGVEALRFEIKGDGTWRGSSPDGALSGTWSRDGDDVHLTTLAGDYTLKGTLTGDALTIGGPGLPFTTVLRRE